MSELTTERGLNVRVRVRVRVTVMSELTMGERPQRQAFSSRLFLF